MLMGKRKIQRLGSKSPRDQSLERTVGTMLVKLKLKIVFILSVIGTVADAASLSLPDRFLGNWEDITVTDKYVDGGPWNCQFSSISPGESGDAIIVNMACDMR